ncbi:MAG TPA: succinate dehydrogenase cytochrome b subunit [Bryobacteraceae bacterium]|nr:succinate dehydrogenase cytochrome b subunit [Bryobacteraceae bacterium]
MYAIPDCYHEADRVIATPTTAQAPPRAASFRILNFFSSTVGKKAVMAVTGIILAAFVVGHLIGNLQIFLGPDVFNGYARTLRHLPELVWPVRIVLLISVIAHIWSSLQLAVVKSEARPIGYQKHLSAGSTYASRTMYMSGPIVAAFVIYHLMQFTFGVGGTPFEPFDAYGNVVNGFRVPVVSGFYVVAMGLLCLHLRHGLWSMFQSLGVNNPRHVARLKIAASAVAWAIFLGFISIPIAVVFRVIPQIV